MRPAIARWSAACALLAWATGAAADGAGPALWSIAGERNTVYLFGSVHLLRDGEFRLEGTLSDAYEDAEAVYFEVDIDDLDPVQAMSWALLFFLPALIGCMAGAFLGWLIYRRRFG